MASKTTSSPVIFLTLNLLFFALVSACGSCSGSYPKPKPTPKHRRSYSGGPSPAAGGPSPAGSPSPSGGASCPRDELKLGVCANVLNGLLNVTLGQPPVTPSPCCSILHGLVDLEAAVCFCTALKANILGVELNLPISLSLLLNVCSRQVPPDFQCA